jgi:hypothetical protein
MLRDLRRMGGHRVRHGSVRDERRHGHVAAFALNTKVGASDASPHSSPGTVVLRTSLLRPLSVDSFAYINVLHLTPTETPLCEHIHHAYCKRLLLTNESSEHLLMGGSCGFSEPEAHSKTF